MSALPSLFRWEPGMRTTEGGEFTTRPRGLMVNDPTTGLWFEVIDTDRPDMSHAGTRGLVLEQVRAALGDPHAHVRPVRTLAGVRWMFDSLSYSPALHWESEGECVWDTIEYISQNRDAEARG